MKTLTDHALCDIVLTQDEVYKLRLVVSREIDRLLDNAQKANSLGLTSQVENHLIKRYSSIREKLCRTEASWLEKGSYHLVFKSEGGFSND